MKADYPGYSLSLEGEGWGVGELLQLACRSSFVLPIAMYSLIPSPTLPFKREGASRLEAN